MFGFILFTNSKQLFLDMVNGYDDTTLIILYSMVRFDQVTNIDENKV